MELIVLSGLKTLRLLKDCKFKNELPPKTNGKREETTIQKSRTFHPSLRYAI